MEERKIAIQATGVEKVYKLYDKPSDRLKEALGLSGKKKYREHYALKGVDMTIYQGDGWYYWNQRLRKIHNS